MVYRVLQYVPDIRFRSSPKREKAHTSNSYLTVSTVESSTSRHNPYMVICSINQLSFLSVACGVYITIAAAVQGKAVTR